jgi:hypothetical protein
MFIVVAVAQPSGSPAEIKAKLEDALESLPAPGGASDPAWHDQANALRARLSSLTPVDAVGAAVERARELETLLKTQSSSTAAPLRDALDKLSDAIGPVEASDPVVAFGKRLARLDSLVATDKFPASHSVVVAGLTPLARIVGKIEAADPAVKFKSSGETLAALLKADKTLTGNRSDVLATTQQLFPLLEALEVADPVAAIKRRATSTGVVVDTYVKDKPLKNADEVQKALADLAKKIGDAVTPIVPRIHIIKAKYGDLRPQVSASRRCDATAGMIHQCERMKNCTPPAAISDLCGGRDPAPRAPDSTKVVRVSYQCILGNDRDWGAITGNPGKILIGVGTQEVELSKNTQELACLMPEK